MVRATPRVGLDEHLSKMAGMKSLRLLGLGRGGASMEDFWTNSQPVRSHLEGASKKGWVSETECGRLIVAGFKDERTAASHSFPVDVDDDPTIAGEEGMEEDEEHDGRDEAGDDVDEAQRQLMKRTHINLGHPSNQECLEVRPREALRAPIRESKV